MQAYLRAALLLVALVVASADVAANKKHDKPDPPVWADQYKIKFDFKIPYVRKYQKLPLINKFEIWQDVKHGHQRAVKDGLETVLSLVDDDARYTIYPAKDDYQCRKTKVGAGPSGPTRRRLQAVGHAPGSLHVEAAAAALPDNREEEKRDRSKVVEQLGFVMPDLTESRWVYKGVVVMDELEDLPEQVLRRGVDIHLYEYDLTEGDMHMSYRFYVTHDGVPLRLWQLGINLYTSGHRDVYISDFYDYTPVDGFDRDAFRVPDWGNCKGVNGAAAEEGEAEGVTARAVSALRRVTPSSFWGDAEYDRFVHATGRRHADAAEYERRRAEFHASRARVEGHNDAGRSRHRLALNRFADWTREEYEGMLRRPERTLAVDVPSVGRHVRALSNSLVPAQLSWKGTPADSPVKDQGACGSCWTFSTVGAIESAYYRQVGRQQLFSEQNLVDCNWVKTNKGCYGGQQIDAFNWVFGENRGLATNEDYPYRGVNDFCRHDAPKMNFTGRMVLVEGGEEALKEALASKGPMTVSIDAGDDSFRFYSGGIYRRASCSTKASELDHAVILSGYGTTEDGEDYWLVKNMWSPFWGEEGYMRVARGPNDCGIATEPLYVELEFL